MPPLYDGAPPGAVRSRVADAGRVRAVRDPELYSRVQTPLDDGRSLQQRLDEIERVRNGGGTRGVPDYVSNPPPRDDAAYQRAMGNRPTPSDGTMRRYVHETDIGNIDSIRKSGIRPGTRFGHEAVWANEGTASGRTVPPGRALIEFDADPARIKLRGTTPGSQAAGFQGGPIAPEALRGGYTTAGRVFDAGSKITGIGGLINMLSGFLGGPSIMGPSDMVLNDLIAQNYGPGGIMDPYRDMRDMPGFNPQTGTVPA